MKKTGIYICQLKAAEYKRPHVIRLNLHEISGTGKWASQWVVVRAGGGEGSHCLMGPSVSIWGHETVPELDSHDDCSTLKMYLSQSTVHFKTTTMVNFYVMCILPQQKN